MIVTIFLYMFLKTRKKADVFKGGTFGILAKRNVRYAVVTRRSERTKRGADQFGDCAREAGRACHVIKIPFGIIHVSH